jgi:hypothetical protein
MAKKSGPRALDKVLQKARRAHTKMLTELGGVEQRLRHLGDLLDRAEAALVHASFASPPAEAGAPRGSRSTGTPGKRSAAPRPRSKPTGTARRTAKRGSGPAQRSPSGSGRTPAKRGAAKRTSSPRATAGKRSSGTGRNPGKRGATRRPKR